AGTSAELTAGLFGRAQVYNGLESSGSATLVCDIDPSIDNGGDSTFAELANGLTVTVNRSANAPRSAWGALEAVFVFANDILTGTDDPAFDFAGDFTAWTLARRVSAAASSLLSKGTEGPPFQGWRTLVFVNPVVQVGDG